MILANKVALITGGGRALGRCIALRLAREGASVTVAGPVAEELQETATQVRQLGRPALAVLADVSREDQVNALAEQARRSFGRIDVLINNAGIIGPTALAVLISREQWDEVLTVNLTGAFLCSKAVLPEMIERKSGKIINIASVAGKIAYPLRSPYAVSKWGLIGLTLTLAKEMGRYNIQVNAVCPGPVQGPRMQQIIRKRAQELNQSVEEAEQSYLDAAALGRMVKEEDVAALVSYLASAQADNITGQAIDVSAGYGL